MRDKGELVAIVAINLSKAFDVLQHDLLLAKLKAYGVGEGSCALLKDYLLGRQQPVKIGETFWKSAFVKKLMSQISGIKTITIGLEAHA